MTYKLTNHRSLSRACDRLDKLIALAEAILAKDPNNKEVQERLRQLKAERDLLDDLWNKKNKELLAAKDQQVCVE